MSKKTPPQLFVSGAGRNALALSHSITAAVLARSAVLARFFYKIGDAFKSLNERVANSGTAHLSVKEQAFFVKRLSFLIKASIPILEGLSMVSEQTVSKGYSRVLKSVVKDVSNGTSLAKSLSKFPRIFGDFGINIIKVGESSGTLSQNLDYLADELHKRQALRNKITGALVYPAVITVATLGITGFLILYLFPKIMPVFSSLNMELPLSTKIVIAVSGFLQQWGLWFIVGVFAFGALSTFLINRFPKVRMAYDRMMLSLPVFGVMFRYYNLANMNRTLGLLLKSGITLAEALPLTADTTANTVYKRELRLMAAAANRGEQLSGHLKKHRGLFPDLMPQMIAIGERSGSLSNTLVYLSGLYEAEVDDFTKNLSSLIEPALMIIMGVLVGFTAISIITPIYGITQNLSR